MIIPLNLPKNHPPLPMWAPQPRISPPHTLPLHQLIATPPTDYSLFPHPSHYCHFTPIHHHLVLPTHPALLPNPVIPSIVDTRTPYTIFNFFTHWHPTITLFSTLQFPGQKPANNTKWSSNLLRRNYQLQHPRTRHEKIIAQGTTDIWISKYCNENALTTTLTELI